MDEIHTLKDEFLTEAREHIESAENDILEIEKQGNSFDSELINRLFRSIHSIKGGSGFLELTLVTELAHGIENVIDSIRNGKTKPDENIIEVLLISVDKLKTLLNNPDANVSIRSEVNSLKQLVLSPIISGNKGESSSTGEQDKKKESPREKEKTGGDTFTHESLLTRALKKRNMVTRENQENDSLVITQEEISSLMKQGYHIYRISMDLLTECDMKERSLGDFFHSIHILGTIHDAMIEVSSAGTLTGHTGDRLLYHIIISTVIEDWNMLSKGLDITPVSITRLLAVDSEKSGADSGILMERESPQSHTPGTEEKDFPIQNKVKRKTDDTGNNHEKVVHKENGGNGSLLNKEDVQSGMIKDGVHTKEPEISGLKNTPGLKNLIRDSDTATTTALVKSSTEVSTLNNKKKEENTELLQNTPSYKQSTPLSTTIRINISLADKLMNLVSELVLVRNQNIQAVESGHLPQIQGVAKKLNVVTSELQAGIMQTRMQQLELVFSRFSRLVRDLGKKLNKEVEIEIQGRHVELDKNIIEAIGDPLTHIIRNAVDHGIESAAERANCNKPIIGKIKLAAFHEAGHVNIKISDDGRGIDPERLKAAAVKKGIMTPAQAKAMTTQAAYNLIFRPGFSTASLVTDVSGRGVGMDVVKSNLEKFGAVINIFSTIGEGTMFEIKLPLTLAIISALIVRVQNLNFAIPQFNIAEIVWLYGEEGLKKIKNVNKQEVLSIRGRLIPAVRLSRILGIEKENDKDITPNNGDSPHTVLLFSFYVVVLKLGNMRYGLIVDQVIDTKEIVVKPLHEQIKNCKVYSGTSVLGDGNIAVILDISNIARLANVNIRQIEEQEPEHKINEDEVQSVIIFSIGGREYFSIPLFLIRHIEKVGINDLMHAHNREYHYYQEHLVPLIRLENILEDIRGNYLSDIFIIILKTHKPIGILAAQILDTTTITNSFDVDTVSREGVLGSVVKENELILILDTFKIIEKVEPRWFKESFKKSSPGEKGIKKILVIEDTQFYSSIIKSFLKGSGIEVVLAKNGKEGIEKVSEERFNLIISDLEMPNMDGFEFARYMKSNSQLQNIPLVALSGAFSEKEGWEKAAQAGFNYFVTKKNKDAMFNSLQNILQLY